jgi:hypothetical protein
MGRWDSFNGSDHGTLDTAHDMRSVAKSADLLEHSGFVFSGCMTFEHEYHRIRVDGLRLDLGPSAQQKSRRLEACGESGINAIRAPTRQQAGLK